MSLLFTLAACFSAANAACECGYKTDTGEIWQYSVTTDFSDTSNASFFESQDWDISSLVRAAGNEHPVAINYTPANVAVTNQTLHLKCSAYNSSSDTGIDSAQVQTTRQDILYGSFRGTYSVNGGAGAIGALFFYASDTQETDIETLTRDDPQSVHFTNQPSSTTQMDLPDNLVRSDFADYRLDWKQNVTNFYVNNMLRNNFTTDVPTVNGSVYMNMWADGGNFAGSSPPTSDASMIVKSVHLYFNTSDLESASTWQKACQSTASTPCSVDSETVQSNSTKSKTRTNQGSRNAESSAGKKLAMAVATAVYWSA